MSAPAMPEGVDPAVELAGRYVCTIEAFDRRRGKSDEEVEAFDDDCQMPRERELTKVAPTTRQGVVALLDLVLREQRIDNVGPGEPCWTVQFTIGLLENARDAVREGVA